jgi:hypothetical protein
VFLFYGADGAVVAVFIAVTLLGVALVIWGCIDAYSRPEWAWFRSAQNRGLCLSLMAAGLVLYGPVGTIAAIWYLTAVRPRVAAAEAAGPPAFPYGVRAADLPPPVPGTGYVPPPPEPPPPW